MLFKAILFCVRLMSKVFAYNLHEFATKQIGKYFIGKNQRTGKVCSSVEVEK